MIIGMKNRKFHTYATLEAATAAAAAATAAAAADELEEVADVLELLVRAGGWGKMRTPPPLADEDVFCEPLGGGQAHVVEVVDEVDE